MKITKACILKRKFVELLISLDSNYIFLKDFDLTTPKISNVLFDILARENKEFTAQKLASILVDSDARVRADVIEALEAIVDTNVIGIPMRYKSDRDERVRANAIKALWNLVYREIKGARSEMLSNPDPKAQASAVRVIGEIGHNKPEIKTLMSSLFAKLLQLNL